MISFLARGLVSALLSISFTIAPQGISLSPDGIPSGRFFPVAVALAPIETEPADLFFGYPTLKRICTCESNLTHYENADGAVLRGRVNYRDVGICQINEFYQKGRIERFGFDIYTPEGNIAFAKALFNEMGTVPWESSRACWER